MPRVVASQRVAWAGGTSTSPEAAAISSTAVWPSPSSPNGRDDRFAERAGDSRLRGTSRRSPRPGPRRFPRRHRPSAPGRFSVGQRLDKPARHGARPPRGPSGSP